MKEALKKYCPNYDMIVEFDYRKDDLITKHLIDYYRDLAFSEKEEDLPHLTKLDLSLFSYINNNDFYKKVQNHFLGLGNYEDDIISNFIKLYDDSEDTRFKEVKNTKWI
jgi:hypothetical protein